jgi:hypothetical protein
MVNLPVCLAVRHPSRAMTRFIYMYIAQKQGDLVIPLGVFKSCLRRSLFIRVKAILSSKMMVRKYYDRKGSVTKIKSLVVILEAYGAKLKLLEVNRQS